MEELIQKVVNAIRDHAWKHFDCPVRVLDSFLWLDPDQIVVKCGIQMNLSENLSKEIREALEGEIKNIAKNCEMNCHDCPAN